MDGWRDTKGNVLLKDEVNTLWIDVVLDICKELLRKEGRKEMFY